VVQIRDVLDQGDMLLQQPQRPARIPFGWDRARQRDQPGLDLAGDLRLDRRRAALLTTDRRPNIAIMHGIYLRDVPDRLDTDTDPLRDLPSTRGPATALIELQQDPRTTDLLRGMRPGPDHSGQPLTLVGTQHHRRQRQPRHHTSSWQGKETAATDLPHHKPILTATRY
jgi:hypothetical protein